MASNIPIGECLAAICKTPNKTRINSGNEKWKIENREKNRQRERERKDRLVRIISKLESGLPDTYLDKCRSQLKKKTPTVVKTVLKNNALVEKREAKIPQYLILEAKVVKIVQSSIFKSSTHDFAKKKLTKIILLENWKKEI